jgi:predicted ATPase
MITEEKNNQTPTRFRLRSIGIRGYRPFRDFTAEVGDLEVIVGANGAGKSALFEFLKFLRDGMSREIPLEIIEGAIGQKVFHSPGPEKLDWRLEIKVSKTDELWYEGGIVGPVGLASVYREVAGENLGSGSGYAFLNVQGGSGFVGDKLRKDLPDGLEEIRLQRRNQLALGAMTNPGFLSLYRLREYVSNWRFYSALKINSQEIRRPVLTEPEPMLREDASNLSAVLHYLMTEHRGIFDELHIHLRGAVPGFKGLTVKAYGGRGQVMAFWLEEGVDQELNLADLSDGVLRLLCWLVLCKHPNPPSLICIDEPEQGVHPRTLPLLAGLFKKAAHRTQVFLATHHSYLLTQFDLSELAVMRKEGGAAVFIKPSNSKTLMDNLADFGLEELEWMHRSDELEILA